jgi:hypothetical protein
MNDDLSSAQKWGLAERLAGLSGHVDDDGDADGQDDDGHDGDVVAVLAVRDEVLKPKQWAVSKKYPIYGVKLAPEGGIHLNTLLINYSIHY